MKHYAGDVTYEVIGMIEKNKDTLLKDHLEMLQMSEVKFLVSLFPDVIDQVSFFFSVKMRYFLVSFLKEIKIVSCNRR